MTLVDELSILVLTQNDTGHVIIFVDIAANHKIIIFQIFYFNPVFCAFILDVDTILAFGYDAL